jgi:hypothetical protein
MFHETRNVGSTASKALGAFHGLEYALVALRPKSAVLDPFAKFADLIFREAQIGACIILACVPPRCTAVISKLLSGWPGTRHDSPLAVRWNAVALLLRLSAGLRQGAVVTAEAVLLKKRASLRS